MNKRIEVKMIEIEKQSLPDTITIREIRALPVKLEANKTRYKIYKMKDILCPKLMKIIYKQV